MDDKSTDIKLSIMNQTVILKHRPQGMPQLSDFDFTSTPIPVAGEGQVLLKALFVSVDPYLRGKMSGTYHPSFQINEAIGSRLVAQVITSRHPAFAVNDYVVGYLDWSVYQLSDGKGLLKVDDKAIALSAQLGLLGSPGLSAYFALLNIGVPTTGETLVVSGAAGAVGSLAGQIGKIMGCYVVGIAGSDEKTAWLTQELGFDAAVNYKTGDLSASLQSVCPRGIDIYFDNVGGSVSDAVMPLLNNNARVPVCGAISNYNSTTPEMGPRLLPLIVYKRLSLKGFLIADFTDQFPKGKAQLISWMQEGKLQYKETILQGFDQLPTAFIGLFEGRNEGKMIVKL